MDGTDILVALGRTTNTRGIGLENAGLEVTEKGHIRVNDGWKQPRRMCGAMGECANSPYFTHVSEDDFAIIHENLRGETRGGDTRSYDSRGGDRRRFRSAA